MNQTDSSVRPFSWGRAIAIVVVGAVAINVVAGIFALFSLAASGGAEGPDFIRGVVIAQSFGYLAGGFL